MCIRDSNNRGWSGRFGAGLPAISDGSFLFLQHMISKMKRDGEGSKIGIVFNGSPLFSGGAGSGTSEIRRWIIENAVSYTHLRAHATVLDIVCRLLLAKKKPINTTANNSNNYNIHHPITPCHSIPSSSPHYPHLSRSTSLPHY